MKKAYNKQMVTAGLTGNFGMGKSYVLSVFESLGAETIDSDNIVHQLLKEKTVIQSVVSLLGKDCLGPDLKLDKPVMAQKIFHNIRLRKKLEELLHPLVFARIMKIIEKKRKTGNVIIVEVPLLFEGGYQDRFDMTITVYTTQQKAIDRLKGRGITRAEAVRRLRTQMPIRLKMRCSDYIVNNSLSRVETRKQASRIYRLLQKQS